jgi:hypothetical protein
MATHGFFCKVFAPEEPAKLWKLLKVSLKVESAQAAFEKEILALAGVVFSEYADILARLGLRVDGPEVIHANQPSKPSELRVYFWEGKCNIVDAFEISLVRGGEPVASKESIESWIRETLDDVVRRRREALARKDDVDCAG